jgi:hypothetical protein
MNFKSYPTLSTAWKVMGITAILVMLAGCGGATPTLAPTADLQATENALGTEVALTIVADLTQNAPPTATTAPPTEVPPTDTPVPTEPPAPTATLTLVPSTPTNTRIPATLAPTNTPTPASFTCSVEDQSPEFGDDFPPNADFDGRWVIENTGNETWEAAAVDIRHVAGTEFHLDNDAYDLGSDIAPDDTFTFVVDMRAPSSPGRYSTTWALVQGGSTLCTLALTIDVIQ